MFFLGTTFFSGRNVIDPSLTKIESINEITLYDGKYDHLFVSKNPELDVSAGYDEWDFDTCLNATYDKGNLDAGNSGFSLETTDTILIKCREKGTYDWTVIFARDIKATNDFKISVKDFFRKSYQDYEYMLVSVCDGIENSFVMADIYSHFEGMYICDKNEIYGTMIDLCYLDTNIETNGTSLSLLNNRYPTIVNNSISHYESGNASGTFIKLDQDTREIDIKAGIDLRDTVKKFLNNKRPKILKFYDGRLWLVGINGSVSDTADGHNDKRKISFDWIEIGDANSMEDLYNSGLSDVGREWWY